MYADQVGKSWSWLERNSINPREQQLYYHSNSQHERYDFGEERTKISKYVEEQLHGDEAKKNYDILVKFQKEAEERKHRQLHRNRVNFNMEGMAQNNSQFYTVEHSPVSQHQKVLGYGSGPRFSLLPADKFKPPIYRY
jgi:hypothetical protein